MPLPYPILFSTAGDPAPPASTTIIADGGWGWPNIGEPTYQKVGDISKLTVGERVFIDDGVKRGELLVTGVGDTFPDFVTFENDAPPGGTEMADGALVVVIEIPT